MHTIDLLKGQGLPAKTTLGSVMFTAFVFVVPVLIAAGLLGFYAINGTTIEVLEQQKTTLNKSIKTMGTDAEDAKSLIDERNAYVKKYNEVAKCVNTYIEWTPVLTALVENIPDNMFIENLSAKTDQPKTGRRNSDPNKPLVIPVPKRTVAMELFGVGEEKLYDSAENYQKELESGHVLPYLENSKLDMKINTADNSEMITLNFTFNKAKE